MAKHAADPHRKPTVKDAAVAVFTSLLGAFTLDAATLERAK